MTEIVVPQQLRPITYNGNVVGIQLDINVMIRIYMKVASPQRFGIRVIRELPDTLKQDDVRKTLGIPEFDKVIIRETTHSPLEADLTLLKNKQRVAEFSVKATPTGNLDYIVKSWREERRNLDLLAIVPLEGRKDGKDLYFVALIIVPKALKAYKASQIKKYILSVIDAKRISEKLDRLWLTDFSELANVIRDLKIIQISRLQEKIMAGQKELADKFDRMLDFQETIIKSQKELADKFDRMLDILAKIYDALKKKDGDSS